MEMMLLLAQPVSLGLLCLYRFSFFPWLGCCSRHSTFLPFITGARLFCVCPESNNTHIWNRDKQTKRDSLFFHELFQLLCAQVYIYISLTLKKKCSLDVFLHFFYFKGIVLKSCHEKIWKDKSLSHFSETKKCYSNYFSLVMKSAVENWLSRKNLQTLNEENAALRKTLTGERNSKRFNVIQLLWK